MKSFWRLLSYSKPYRGYLPEYILFAMLAVLFGVFNFSLLIPLLNVLFGTVNIPEKLVQPEFDLSARYAVDLFNFQMYSLIRNDGLEYALYFICGIIFLFIFLSNLSKYIAQRVITRMRTRLMENLRKAIFHKYTELNFSYLNNEKKGNLITIISNDVQDIEFSVLISLEAVFREPLLIIGYFSFLFALSPQLTVFTLLYLPVAGLLINLVSRKLKSGDGLALMSNLISITEETLSGLRVIKIFNAEKFVREKFDETNHAFRNYIKGWLNKREMASPSSEILGVLSAIGIILYGGHLVITKDAEMDASKFITYIVLFSQVLSPAKAMSNAYATLQRGLVAADRIFSMMDSENDIREAAQPKPLHGFSKELVFDHVSFSYGQKQVLHDVSFRLERGKTMALVGPSGGGKSTIVDLMVRFYDPDSGNILVDGEPIKELSLFDLRQQFGMVNQDTILFNDTIFNNIAFGNMEATQEMVEEAARIANAHSFIIESEQGYQTRIGDRGARLSGGQRQRLSIARAILKDPSILILDEATSALDTESEKLVQDALASLMNGRTAIVIAHRLSTIQNADWILVLDKGKIVEAGTHQSLYQIGGLYTKLVDLQSF